MQMWVSGRFLVAEIWSKIENFIGNRNSMQKNLEILEPNIWAENLSAGWSTFGRRDI